MSVNVLSKAKNVEIQKATFNTTTHSHTHTTNHVLQTIQTPTDTAEMTLHNARAVEATHTSSTASYAPKCTPETRVQVIADIVEWVVGDTVGADEGELTGPPRLSILWFSGPAGGGKTTIMRNVVDRCEAAGLLAASYFFSTRAAELSTETRFVATIAHQLANSDPILKLIIYNAIQDRPTIFEESLDFQMNKLVVKPLQSKAFRSSPRKVFIAIDGFDECREEEERQHLLGVLLTLVRSLQGNLAVVLASRPELDLRTAFEDEKTLKEITAVIRLQDYEGDNDIRIYLCDEFERIRKTHPLRKSIPADWPLEEIIQLLINKASGNFIYPATVIKYIRNPRRNPVDSLNEILALSKGSPTPPTVANPLAELDALYGLILHPPNTNILLLKRILHCLLGLTAIEAEERATPSFLDQFLGLLPGTTTLTLCDLHSILSIPEDEDQPIALHHKSLEDYLKALERSQDLYQSPYDTYLDLTMACTAHMQRWASKPVIDPSSHVEFSALNWEDCIRHCILSMSSFPSMPSLPDVILRLDPRILLKYRFINSPRSPLTFYGVRNVVEQGLCKPQQQCLPLCGLLTRIADCSQALEAFAETISLDPKERLKALLTFELETGLYDPLVPPPSETPGSPIDTETHDPQPPPQGEQSQSRSRGISVPHTPDRSSPEVPQHPRQSNVEDSTPAAAINAAPKRKRSWFHRAANRIKRWLHLGRSKPPS